MLQSRRRLHGRTSRLGGKLDQFNPDLALGVASVRPSKSALGVEPVRFSVMILLQSHSVVRPPCFGIPDESVDRRVGRRRHHATVGPCRIQRDSTFTTLKATGWTLPPSVFRVNETALAIVDDAACSASGLSTGST